ncbi:hypothetical protein K461DRAFT_316974 [Myriangium duriaei CBS 260.36]|uniref:Histidine kinase n=1 Tax=Myriangium duriaei CBS 260.36 TaxID=1168546 RepID=A0A9P4J7G9_9PEZI|nr:hypothetical protein K461DRAFT_316974 [Myriangium duriaei CBS 260.36]
MKPRPPAGDRLRLLQEREVHQYFQPWLAANGSAFSVASNVDSIASQDLQELGYVPQRSQDKTLAAFAQLATLRLNVRRAMVSLIDSKHQYILIEATKTQSFLDDSRDDKSDDLWLGNAILKRDEAVCHHCFTNTYSVADKHGQIYQTKALVVDDCRKDDRFKDRSYVVGEPGVRFYAGVPIVTRSGHAIGAYAVSDELPREGLSISEIKYMEDVAFAIMGHLEWAKDRVDRFKTDRIIRGLGCFIDRTNPIRRNQSNALHNNGASVNGAEPHQPEGDHLSRVYTELRNDFATEFAPGKRVAVHNDRDFQHSESESDIDPAEAFTAIEVNAQTRAARQQEDLHQLLTRAARSLRQCTLADGAIFFEVPEAISEHDGEFGDLPGPAEEVGVLSVSLHARAEEQSAAASTLKRATLDSYFQHFPIGKSFHFTADGIEISADDEVPEEDGDSVEQPMGASIGTKRKRQPASETGVAHREVLEKLPGVRELVFLPLRDFITGKWIAGGFLWSNTFGRMMDMGQDLPHLNAFAHGLVSEVVRMNVEQLSRSKTAFIASMSHELRSPLHGILGSVEFMNDTKMDSYQAGLVSSIANCSRTLLDTLSNLLSYAKVSQTEPSTNTSKIDMALLVEEVVESVCAGHAFRKEHTAGITALPHHNSPDLLQHAVDNNKRRRLSITQHGTYTQAPGEVSIVLEIATAEDWHISTNPGAVRRVVMNLVGNALKYTPKGYISVSLQLQHGPDGSEAVIRVADSGKGISGSFLKKNLFVPFKQEDSYSSGTGLGLSIVKQLVDSLGGTISVQSILDKGTEFQINIPVKQIGSASAPHYDDDVDDDVLAIVHDTRAKRVSIVNPNEEQSAAMSLACVKTRASLADLCSTWFGMDVIKTRSPDIGEVDVTVLTRPAPMSTIFEQRRLEGLKPPKGVIVICPSGADAVSVTNDDATGLVGLGHIVEVVSQPCGPRKLAQALKRCLQRYDERTTPDNDNRDTRPSIPAFAPLPFPILAPSGLAIEDPIVRVPSPQVFASVNFDHEVPPTLESSSATPNSSFNKRVLIVDDNKVNIDLMARFVGKFRIPHEQAFNGAEAVQRFKAAHARGQAFDYVLMDVSMPIMDGLEASRIIRRFEIEQGGGDRARIVALSGFEAENIQTEAKESGVDIYLSKPIRFAKLKEILQRDLG